MGGNRDHPGVEASDPVAGPWKYTLCINDSGLPDCAGDRRRGPHRRTPRRGASGPLAAGSDHDRGHSNILLRAQLVAHLVDRANRERRHGRTLTLLAAACIESSPSIPPELHDRVEDQLGALLPPSGIVQARTRGRSATSYSAGCPSTCRLSAAAAAATVRTAALINWPARSPYWPDTPRASSPGAARACPCLQYFDPHEYAQRVLAEGPLGLS